jgi:hypothetical protein
MAPGRMGRGFPGEERQFGTSISPVGLVAYRIVLSNRKLLKAHPDHLDDSLMSSGANGLCDPLFCHSENISDILLAY